MDLNFEWLLYEPKAYKVHPIESEQNKLEVEFQIKPKEWKMPKHLINNKLAFRWNLSLAHAVNGCKAACLNPAIKLKSSELWCAWCIAHKKFISSKLNK